MPPPARTPEPSDPSRPRPFRSRVPWWRRLRTSRAWSRPVAAAIATVVTATTLVSPAAAGTPTIDRSGIQQAIDTMVEHGAPGVLARTDGPEGHRTATSGVGDLEEGSPVPPDAHFRAASLTKSVVAAVVLQLVAEERLDLDAPVGTWLAGIPGGDRITPRQLLGQTSGLADYTDHPEFKDVTEYGARTWQPRQLIDLAAELGPVAEPGAGFNYSNTSTIILGLLVEEITGNPLGSVLSHRIFEPTGMDHTDLPVTRETLPEPHATGYYLPPETDYAPGALRPITELNPSFAWAAYGLVSTARDMNRFYQALFGGQLVPDALLAQMREGVPTPQVPVFPHYGLGLESVGLTCGELWGHTGSIPGCQTLSFADATGSRQMTISMNLQRNDPEVAPLLLAAVDALNRYFCGQPYTPPARD